MGLLYIGLVHYPVYNKNFEKIASAVTTVDLHDISRLARTYGVKQFYVITPLKDQQVLAERIKSHWTEGYGAEYNLDRKKALEILNISPSLDESIGRISEIEGQRPLVITTDASRQEDKNLSFAEAKKVVTSQKPVLILFGTAWGLDSEVIKESDFVLDPIDGPSDYNHLSVRSAAAIIIDRLAGSN